jgi:hypothetical protein
LDGVNDAQRVGDLTLHPVAGAPVIFTLSIPGVAPITQDGTTDGAGTAIFATTLARGPHPATALPRCW